METKILIITKNNLSLSFWSQYINASNLIIEIIHIDSFKFSPEILKANFIILDNYFDSQESETWMRYQAHFLRSKSYDKKIFFLSPHYADYQQENIIEFSQVSKYVFSNEFISVINESILSEKNNTIFIQQI